MKIVADTNVILRLLVSGVSDEDARQALVVAELLERCDAVIFPTHAFCEMVWVMQRGYRFTAAEIVAGIEKCCASKIWCFMRMKSPPVCVCWKRAAILPMASTHVQDGQWRTIVMPLLRPLTRKP